MFDVQPPLESTESNKHRQTAACRLAVERLLAYLKDPDSHRAERDAAIGHMSVCVPIARAGWSGSSGRWTWTRKTG